MYNGKILRLLLSTNINIPIKVGGIFPYLNKGCNLILLVYTLVYIVFYLKITFLHGYLT